jgi:hypothetical protein
MSSAAQVLANRANAQHSTGPQTAAGKTRSSQNAHKHGLASGILVVPEPQQVAFHQFEANLKQAVQPRGALEQETCNQLLHAAWRLRTLHGLMRQLWARHQADPVIVPEAAAELRQLTRYRATLEMAFYRALKQIRELQTRRAGRELQLHSPERLMYPPQLNPAIYSAARLSHGDRHLVMQNFGLMGNHITHRVVLDENHLPCEHLEPLSPVPLNKREWPAANSPESRSRSSCNWD